VPNGSCPWCEVATPVERANCSWLRVNAAVHSAPDVSHSLGASGCVFFALCTLWLCGVAAREGLARVDSTRTVVLGCCRCWFLQHMPYYCCKHLMLGILRTPMVLGMCVCVSQHDPVACSYGKDF
jgi:hypothetical protein